MTDDKPRLKPCICCGKGSSIEVVWPDSYTMTVCVSCAPKDGTDVEFADAWDELRQARQASNG